MMKPFVFAILALSVVGCDSSTDPTGPSLNEEFTLQFGQTVTLKNEPLTITFKSVLEDSRCPTGAECPWEGNARILIQISQTDIELNTTLEPKQATYQAYTIRLVAVEPYPILNEEIEPEDYSIKIIVTRN